MTDVPQLREELAKVLNREQSLDELNEWLTRHAWDRRAQKNRGASALAGEIELALAEYSEGHLSRAGLRARLQTLAGIRSNEQSRRTVSRHPARAAS